LDDRRLDVDNEFHTLEQRLAEESRGAVFRSIQLVDEMYAMHDLSDEERERRRERSKQRRLQKEKKEQERLEKEFERKYSLDILTEEHKDKGYDRNNLLVHAAGHGQGAWDKFEHDEAIHYDQYIHEHHSFFETNRAAIKIQSAFRGVLATATVLALWMKMEQEEEERAVLKIQAAGRARKARKLVEERRKEMAQDLGWSHLPASEIPPPAYVSPLLHKKLHLKLSSDVDNLLSLVEKGDTKDGVQTPQFNSLEKLNAKMMGNVAQSEHLDLSLAHFEKPELDPEVLRAVTYDKHLVQDEDYYHSDSDNSDNENITEISYLETTIIGDAEDHTNKSDTSSSSESDSVSESDEESLSSPSGFQRFESGKLGIRTMTKPKSEQQIYEDTSYSPVKQVNVNNNTPVVPSVDLNNIPTFLKSNVSIYRGGSSNINLNRIGSSNNNKSNTTFHKSLTSKSNYDAGLKNDKITTSSNVSDAASKGSEKSDNSVSPCHREELIIPTSAPLTSAQSSDHSPSRNIPQQLFSPSLSNSVHIVGQAAAYETGHLTSLSEETPRSIANAYGMDVYSLLELNEATLPHGTNLDEPLWLGTPIMLPGDAVQIQNPSVGANTSLLGSRGPSRSHRQNATGITSQTSLLKEASKLRIKHLLRMNGQPSDILASYADDPIVSPEHEKYALSIYDAGLDEHGAQYYHPSDPFSRSMQSTTNAAPKPRWYEGYSPKVDLKKIGEKSRLRSGRTSKGIREDGRRDRRAAEYLARKHDHENAELFKLKQQAKKIKKRLKQQYSTGPGQKILTEKSLAGKILRQQVREGNMTQYKRLAKFFHPSGGTDRVVENVKFIGRLLMVNPSTGSPTKTGSKRIPAVRPGSRLTLRIEANNMGYADEAHPIKQHTNDIGCILAVQRGTLVNFEVRTGKTSGLSIVPSVGGEKNYSKYSGRKPNKELNAGPCRMLWKGNRCVVDIPLLCGKGAVSGLSSVKLSILVGQRVGMLKFATDVMSSYTDLRRNGVSSN
jgi:hypothetical protein